MGRVHAVLGAVLAAFWAVSSVSAQDAAPSGARPGPPSAGHQRMLALLQQLADETPATNSYLGEGLAPQFREGLSALPATDVGTNRWRLMVQLAEEELRLGNEDEAIRLFTGARDMVPDVDANRTILDYNTYRLGVAYMRLAETQNCALHPNAEACILPLRGRGIHSLQTPSRQAIAAFTDVLENMEGAVSKDLPAGASGRSRTADVSPRTSLNEAARQFLAARWLLNIAYMTVGGYPDQVPEQYLLPPETFESADTIPRFANIAPALGLDTFDLSGGAIADDFDNDGYLDIVVSTWDTQGQLRLFRNNRDGTFSERTEEAGLLGLYGGLNIIQADYDNDGHVDLLVLRGAWLRERGRHPNSLLRNNGDGTFTDTTFEAGLGAVHYPSQTASWGDYDNDGDLDLYVGNETTPTLAAPSQLFRNNGDGTFADVAEAAGVLNTRFAKAVVWGDYDGDGLLDLYVSNLGAGNRLYRNTGRGSFIDEAPALGVAAPIGSFPAWFWDVDNDGLLDLFVSAYSARIEHLAASALGLPVNIEMSRLYRGTGGGFENVSGLYGLTEPTAAMGSNFGDLDNDGYLDFYLGTGYPHYHSLMPNVMYRNRDGRGFSNVTYAGGFGHLQKGHGVVFADLDNDGDQDVFEQMGGAFPGDRFGNALYENPGFGNHWITVKLEGVRSNRSAIGARLHAVVVDDDESVRRSIYRHVNSGGSFGGNPLRQTIGLGTASRLERLDIFWPATGITQTFADLPLDRVIHIVEGEESYSTLALRTLALGSQ